MIIISTVSSFDCFYEVEGPSVFFCVKILIIFSILVSTFYFESEGIFSITNINVKIHFFVIPQYLVIAFSEKKWLIDLHK